MSNTTTRELDFYIEDTGTWTTDAGPHDHFDRYAGFLGPRLRDNGFPSA